MTRFELRLSFTATDSLHHFLMLLAQNKRIAKRNLSHYANGDENSNSLTIEISISICPSWECFSFKTLHDWINNACVKAPCFRAWLQQDGGLFTSNLDYNSFEVLWYSFWKRDREKSWRKILSKNFIWIQNEVKIEKVSRAICDGIRDTIKFETFLKRFECNVIANLQKCLAINHFHKKKKNVKQLKKIYKKKVFLITCYQPPFRWH